MNPEDIASVLDELGRRIGPYGEAAWHLLVKQQVIEGVVWTIASGVAVTAGVVIVASLARLTRRLYAADVAAYAAGKGRWSGIRSNPDLGDYLFPWVIGGFIGGLVWLVVAAVFIASLIKLLNPEYAALEVLLRTVAGSLR